MSILTKIMTSVLIVAMGLMVLVVTWQIFTRFILNDPSMYSEEMAGFLLIWIGMLGSVYALKTKSHIGIDIFTKNLKGKEKTISIFMIYSLIILFSLSVLVIGGSRLVHLTFSLDQISPALGIKMSYIYLVIPLSGVLIIIYSIDIIRKTIMKSIN